MKYNYRKIVNTCCCVLISAGLLSFPMAGYASDLVDENPEAYYEERANHIVDNQLDANSFLIKEDEQAQSLFNMNNIQVSAALADSSDREVALSDEETVKSVVYEYNKITLSSLFSGVFQLMPREYFVSEDIYQEANARNLYELFNKPAAGEDIESYDFSVDFSQIDIGQTYARVVANRHADVVYSNSTAPNRSYGSIEGYLLKKDNDTWKIENVLFATDFVTPKFNEFVDASDEDSWGEPFVFDNCQRKHYESDMNFSDYIEGSIDAPKLKIDSIMLSYGDNDDSVTEQVDSSAKAGYLKARCAQYARQFGNNPNTDYYVYFTALQGGDCTNFVSQCIYHAGLPMTAHWYHNNKSSYSTSWIRVVELRDYLINNHLAKGYYEQMPNYPSGVNIEGTPIQFSNGTTWSHSAIVLGKDNGGYYVAEHTGPNGNSSYRSIGNSLSKKRTFWIGAS